MDAVSAAISWTHVSFNAFMEMQNPRLDFIGRLALLYVLYQAFLTMRMWSNAKDEHCRAGIPHKYKRMKGMSLWLRTKWWLPSTKHWKGIVFVVHGMNEHASRYHYVASYFARHGYAVFAMDHRGHGLSEGERLYVEKFEFFAADYFEFVHSILALDPQAEYAKATRMNLPDSLHQLPRFLLGHSMGALISLDLALTYRDLAWSGLILTAGALKLDPVSSPPHMVFLAKLLSQVFPKMRFHAAESHFVVRDLSTHERILRDPLNSKLGPTVRMAAEFLGAIDRVQRQASQFTAPLLVFHGDQDKLATPSGSTEFFARAASKEKELHMLPGMYHEILNESCRDDLLRAMVDWISKLTDQE